MTSAHDMALGEESPPEEPSDPPGNWRSLTRIPQTLNRSITKLLPPC